jgi:dTDP-glucose pyrophosphorylase
MKDWRRTLIQPSTPILEAIRIIDVSALQIALVVDENGRLVGVITDGDVRRAILKGVSLDSPVHLIMYRDFTTVNSLASREQIISLMKKNDVKHMPVVDETGAVVDLKVLIDLIDESQKDNWVVIMAGGEGTRLRPLTDERPKPLLEVGGKPILETILDNFVSFGFNTFFVSVNYKSEMIEDFCGDGSKWGVDIQYLREKKKMGTVGAVSLLPSKPDKPLIIINADVLTNVNLQQLLDFHTAHKAAATMCVQDYLFEVPYGVIKINQHRIEALDEKPIQRFFVNAGIYVLEPTVLDLIPTQDSFDMTDLFTQLIARGFETVAFPIREYWMDIGRVEDYQKAKGDYCDQFPKYDPER